MLSVVVDSTEISIYYPFSKHCFDMFLRIFQMRYQMKDCGHFLSTDTPLFPVGFVVWILQPLKVMYFFAMLKMLNIDQFCSAEKLAFWDTLCQTVAK